MLDDKRVIDASDILRIYKVWEKTPQFDPTIFMTVSLAYWRCHPDVLKKMASKYVTLGWGHPSNKAFEDVEYVEGLLDFALRQPQTDNVCRAAAMAVGLSSIPDAELGKMTGEERYLALQATLQLAQQAAAQMARELISDGKPQVPDLSLFTPRNILIAVGCLVVLWLALSGA